MEHMILIPEAQAAGALSMRDCLAAVRRAFIACAEGRSYPTERIAMPLASERNSCQWLSAICLEPPFFGTKFSAVFPDNTQHGLPCDQSTISLYSLETGEQLALIGANYLTALKTGAGAGTATDLLARPDAARLGIIGTGTQAFTQVLAIQEVRALDELRIYDMSPARMQAFAERVSAVRNRPYDIRLCGSAEECVRGADILCTVTPSRTPVFDADALQPGTHINAIGSFTPYMQELPEGAVVKAAFAVTEHTEGLWAAAGDILTPLDKGLITRDKVRGSVGDLLTRKIEGRRSSEEITLYESVGSCVLDMAIAIAVYGKCRGTTEQASH